MARISCRELIVIFEFKTHDSVQTKNANTAVSANAGGEEAKTQDDVLMSPDNA